MIKLEIDSVEYDLDDDLRSRITDRIGGLDEFMNDLNQGHVTVSWEGGSQEQTRVRAELSGGGTISMHRIRTGSRARRSIKRGRSSSRKSPGSIRRIWTATITAREKIPSATAGD